MVATKFKIFYGEAVDSREFRTLIDARKALRKALEEDETLYDYSYFIECIRYSSVSGFLPTRYYNL